MADGQAGEKPKVETVGVIAKSGQEGVRDATRDVALILEERGIDLLIDREAARHLDRVPEGRARRAMVGKVDLVVCLGGDGTLLSVARRFAASKTPIVGVNLGHLGFLTEVEVGDFADFLTDYLEGRCPVRKRMMLDASVEGNGSHPEAVPALNDVVVTKATLARMLDFDVSIDGRFVTKYRADGLIIATPTGSTAYSMAAGGSIVVPMLDAILITPICPHALSQRPIVVHATSEIGVRVAEDHESVYLSLDGQVGHPLPPGAELLVRRSEHETRLVRCQGHDFFDLLRVKLGWGDGA